MIASPVPASPPVSRTAAWPLYARFLLLNAGLLLYGVALAAMIKANVGLAPWDAFHVGLSRVVPGLSVGMASIGVGVVLLALAFGALQMPIGVGSVMNMALIGIYLDLFLARLPHPASIVADWGMFLGGTFLVGVATGTYIASGFGAGPRDSLVLGLQKKTGLPVRTLRTAVEIGVLFGGWAMGAKIGGGTIAYALLIGPCMSVGMGLYGLRR